MDENNLLINLQGFFMSKTVRAAAIREDTDPYPVRTMTARTFLLGG